MKKFIYKLLLAEKSPSKLALSFCFGIFIALTPVIPVIPVQTLLVFVLSWLFRLNTTVTFATTYLVNNPLTMIPIWFIDYRFGSWLFNNVLKIDMTKYNPHWLDSLSAYLSKYVDLTKITGGSSLCLWCLIIGGLVLPLILSVALYPIMKVVFSFLIKKFNRENESDNENHSAE